MPTPAPTLAQAIQQLWGTVSGVPKLWLDEVQEQEGYPRAALKLKGEKPVPGSYDKGTGQPNPSTAEWDIEITVENDSDAAEAMSVAVMQAFKLDALLLSTDPTPEMTRTNYLLKGLGQRSKADKPLYQATISYKAMFDTNY